MSAERTVGAHIPLDELELDPYPVYARLRRESPVAWWEELGGWCLTRWQECRRVLADTAAFGPAPQDAITDRVCAGVPVVTSDGERHEDLRGALVPPMRPAALRDFVDEMVRPVARARAAALADDEAPELMASYFEPISVRALGGVLGLREVDDATLRRWFFGIVSGFTNITLRDDGWATADGVRAEIDATVRPMLERYARHPDDSVLSHMVRAGRDARDARTVDELMPTIIVYITGGMQEPGHGAGSTLLGLLSNPEQLARVRADPSLIPRAVNEGLRWIAPLAGPRRVARDEVALAGVTIAPGSTLNVMVGAANRDPDRFDHPDEFDIDRPSQNHLAFGGGAHVCVGHFFGRAIARIALEELLSSYPEIALDPERELVVRGWRFRAPRELPVRL